jgi:hypothetical protein
MNDPQFEALDDARSQLILARLLAQGPTSHKILREQVIDDYLRTHTARVRDHLDRARFGMCAQLWELHQRKLIVRDMEAGTWDLR